MQTDYVIVYIRQLFIFVPLLIFLARKCMSFIGHRHLRKFISSRVCELLNKFRYISVFKSNRASKTLLVSRCSGGSSNGTLITHTEVWSKGNASGSALNRSTETMKGLKGTCQAHLLLKVEWEIQTITCLYNLNILNHFSVSWTIHRWLSQSSNSIEVTFD